MLAEPWDYYLDGLFLVAWLAYINLVDAAQNVFWGLYERRDGIWSTTWLRAIPLNGPNKNNEKTCYACGKAEKQKIKNIFIYFSNFFLDYLCNVLWFYGKFVID